MRNYEAAEMRKRSFNSHQGLSKAKKWSSIIHEFYLFQIARLPNDYEFIRI